MQERSPAVDEDGMGSKLGNPTNDMEPARMKSPSYGAGDMVFVDRSLQKLTLIPRPPFALLKTLTPLSPTSTHTMVFR